MMRTNPTSYAKVNQFSIGNYHDLWYTFEGLPCTHNSANFIKGDICIRLRQSLEMGDEL
jgi:hypothetical protein